MIRTPRYESIKGGIFGKDCWKIFQLNLHMRFLFIFLIISSFLDAQTPKDCDKLITTGVEYMNQKNYVKSLEFLTRAKAIASQNNMHRQTFLALNNIGANY